MFKHCLKFRLIQVVHRRAEIVDCLEMDRRRQAEEDESIQQHLDVFNSRGVAVPVIDVTPPKSKSKTLKLIHSPMKLMKKEKSKKSKKNKPDVDKEVDETENVKTSPSQSASADSTIASPPTQKEKDKNKTKLWFAK